MPVKVMHYWIFKVHK